MFETILFFASLLAGGVASVTGFGIGSILTPLLGLKIGVKLAVAAVSIPHLAGTAWRFWMLRAHVDRRVLLRFGFMSAAGGLLGALLHARFGGPILSGILGTLLVFAGVGGLTGFSQRLRFGRTGAWIAGLFSGLFGGLVGNQGGIRSAAMLSFDIPKESFVATATAVGIIVDAARMPVYLARQSAALEENGPLILCAVAGVLAGTFLGMRFLRNIPERAFRKVVCALVLCLGVYMLVARPR